MGRLQRSSEPPEAVILVPIKKHLHSGRAGPSAFLRGAARFYMKWLVVQSI